MSWTLCQNVVSLLPIFIIGLFTLAKCDNITTIGEVDAGLNLDLKHDIFVSNLPNLGTTEFESYIRNEMTSLPWYC